MRAMSLARAENAPMRNGGKSIIVVLGMHRSGTSAVTRGLVVLGVELGNHLLPPAWNNEKGFFEDADVYAINMALYRSLKRPLRWHTPASVPKSELLHEKNTPLRQLAIELLRSRLATAEYFGIKDPRICRTLPFWQSVFEHLELNVSYVIAVRNPLSVAKSLEKRNNLSPEKCHYLWLDHVLPAVLLTRGSPRVLVDYDLLLADPQKQISRIAVHLGLVKRLDPSRLVDFSQNFLDRRLRHTRFEPEDIYHDPVVPTPVRTASTVLSDVAADNLSLDSEYVAEVFENLSRQMQRRFRFLFGQNFLLDLFGQRENK
ncbi:MAG: glycosyl transferase family 1 [Betaproteobacteria bacterium]|nr:glycosyl transferase family 1 [Betaproteobacteria bacterium]